METHTCILRVVLVGVRFGGLFLRTVPVSLFVYKIVHILDTPVYQYLAFVGADIVHKLDGGHRILTGCGNPHSLSGSQSLGSQGGRLGILVHGQGKPCVGLVQFAVRNQYLLPVRIIPVCVKQGHHPSGCDFRDVVLMGLGCKLMVQNAVVVQLVQPFKVFPYFLRTEFVYSIVVFVNKPLSVIRSALRDVARRVAQGNHPVPVGRGKSKADSLKAVVRGGMGCQVASEHLFEFRRILRNLVVVFLQDRPLYLRRAGIFITGAAHGIGGQLINGRVFLGIFQLVKLVAVHLLDIGAVLLDQVCQVNQGARLNQAARIPLCINHVGVILFRNHQSHLLIRGRHRIVRLQLYTGGLRQGQCNRIRPGILRGIRIVEGQFDGLSCAAVPACLPVSCRLGTAGFPAVAAASQHSRRQGCCQ